MAAQARTVSDLGLTALQGKNPEITGLAVDSRDVKDGYLFAALPGTQVHGATFIQFALRMGAAAVMTDAEGARIAGKGTHEVITMPQVPDALAPILYAIPAQQIAYYTAIAKGTDVDQPRNLAKSVTVE